MFAFLKRKSAAPEILSTPTAPPPPKKSSAELLVESVTEFRTRMQAIEDQKAAEYEASLKGAQERIVYSDSFVKRTGLDRALPMILKETWHWAAWSKRGEPPALAKEIGFEIVDGEDLKDDEDETKALAFRYAGVMLILFFKQHRSYEDVENNYGSIKLVTAEGEVLISISVAQRIGAEYYDWRYVQVDSLIIGPWVGHIVELEETIRAAAEERVRDYTANYTLDRARNLPPRTS